MVNDLIALVVAWCKIEISESPEVIIAWTFLYSAHSAHANIRLYIYALKAILYISHA
jgi:hypothetical protein